jgi:ribosome-binding protein aMBF1 (putative translation factor)
MKRTTVDDIHKRWMKNPRYRREYNALEQEFSFSAALIEARSQAGLTQEQVAQRMKTTQTVIARLEGGAHAFDAHAGEICQGDRNAA